MGFETGNMHVGSRPAIVKVQRDLARRKGRWLHKATKGMFKATISDWEKWRVDWKQFAKGTSKAFAAE
jgi:hypothetical protein